MHALQLCECTTRVYIPVKSTTRYASPWYSNLLDMVGIHALRVAYDVTLQGDDGDMTSVCRSQLTICHTAPALSFNFEIFMLQVAHAHELHEC